MSPAHVGLSLLPAEDVREAALPLFEEGIVDALEWTIDAAWGPGGIPAWCAGLLDHYAAAGRLYGHGVGLSPMSVGDRARQAKWLERAGAELRARRFVHVSDHFGFGTGGSVVFGAPLPCPRDVAVVRAAHDALGRLGDLAGAPIGLENLALALGNDDVRDQPALLEAILAPLEGFVLLDLHNVWCQAQNFGIAPEALLARYPLERVREIHVSGGSWANGLRRDTHDAEVPNEVIALVPHALARCPRVEVVLMERLGNTLRDVAAMERYRADFVALREGVAVAERASSGTETRIAPPPLGDEGDEAMATLQRVMLEAFEGAQTAEQAVMRLREGPHREWVASLEPRMVEVAIELVAKWSRHQE